MYDDKMMFSSIDFKIGSIPKDSKLMLRKTFVVSKDVVLKKCGTLSSQVYKTIQHAFGQYFNCS